MLELRVWSAPLGRLRMDESAVLEEHFCLSCFTALTIRNLSPTLFMPISFRVI